MTMTTYVFVYGTLKKRFSNHHFLEGAKFVKKAITKPLYKMYNCGYYPCIVDCPNGNVIHGEIYQIDNQILSRLDYLEGYPQLYDRKLIQLQDYNNPVLAYFFNFDYTNLKEIESGIWE